MYYKSEWCDITKGVLKIGEERAANYDRIFYIPGIGLRDHTIRDLDSYTGSNGDSRG